MKRINVTEKMVKHSYKSVGVNVYCNKPHAPNAETEAALKAVDENKDLIEHATVDEFWDSLGLQQ